MRLRAIRVPARAAVPIPFAATLAEAAGISKSVFTFQGQIRYGGAGNMGPVIVVRNDPWVQKRAVSAKAVSNGLPIPTRAMPG